MLLGKRPRLPLKRTASLKEIVFDVGGGGGEAPPPEDPRNPLLIHPVQNNPVLDGLDQRILAMVSPRNNRKHSGADFLETAQFLRACALCQRRLVPGRDIYMYKGDSAFCSVECRQQQMNQDERKAKCSMASKKETVAVSSAASTVTKVSAINGETVAAV